MEIKTLVLINFGSFINPYQAFQRSFYVLFITVVQIILQKTIVLSVSFIIILLIIDIWIYLNIFEDISTDNVAKTLYTGFTESADIQLGGDYFAREYRFNNVPANTHFFEIRFQPWTNIRGINYWYISQLIIFRSDTFLRTPQIAHVEYDERCDPVSTCGNGICEESCVSCPQVSFHNKFQTNC